MEQHYLYGISTIYYPPGEKYTLFISPNYKFYLENEFVLSSSKLVTASNSELTYILGNKKKLFYFSFCFFFFLISSLNRTNKKISFGKKVP